MHNDKYRQYQREGQRLRLKYHNVVRKLEHEQKVEMNEVVGEGRGRGRVGTGLGV